MIFWLGAALLLGAGGIGGQWWYQRARRRCRLLAQGRALLKSAGAYIKNVGGDKQSFLKTLEEENPLHKLLCAQQPCADSVAALEKSEEAAVLLTAEEKEAFSAFDKAFCAQSVSLALEILEKAILIFPADFSPFMKKANAQRAIVFCAALLPVLLLL